MIWRILVDKLLPLAGVFLAACLLWRLADGAGWLQFKSRTAALPPRVQVDDHPADDDPADDDPADDDPDKAVVPSEAESQRPLSPPPYTHGPPQIVRIAVAEFPGSYAIWGALGYQQGSVWFGVSAQGIDRPSAHLFAYQPETGRVVPRGDVLSQLRRAGISVPGQQQMKIHSRIVEASDGCLYFASMDEQGERTDGGRLPTWGSHLWRIRPGQPDWEHLQSIPQGLVAISCHHARWVYALGYFGHVLFQYDTRTGTMRSIQVGSVGGHISRNFLSDERGHVFVPRVRPAISKGDEAGGNASAGNATAGKGKLIATLVELDSELREVGETPLEHYGADATESSHGMIAFAHPRPGTMVFATARGFLYRIEAADGPATVTPLGWFHPDGPSYTPALFTGVAGRHLLGISQRGQNRYDWLVRDSEAGTTVVFPLRVESAIDEEMNDLLLYGSEVVDRQGRFYLGGRYIGQGRKRPILLQVVASGEPLIASAEPNASVGTGGREMAGTSEKTGGGAITPPVADLPERVTSVEAQQASDLETAALQSTGRDWRKADQGKRREISLFLARWLLPGANSQRWDSLARRYVEQLDLLFLNSENAERRLADVMPVIHALVVELESPADRSPAQAEPTSAP